MTTTRPDIDTDATASPVAVCVDVARCFGSGSTAVRALSFVNCRIPVSARIAHRTIRFWEVDLIHLIGGIDVPTTGTVRWPALRADRWWPNGVAVVFQGPSLLPSFDVVQNVALPMLFAGQDEVSARRRSALDLVGMRESAARLPDELSGGQSSESPSRGVVATRPALILADEPTGQLDQLNADRVITALLDTATIIGAALMIATHDPLVAARLTDRWTIRDGRLDAGTTPGPIAP